MLINNEIPECTGDVIATLLVIRRTSGSLIFGEITVMILVQQVKMILLTVKFRAGNLAVVVCVQVFDEAFFVPQGRSLWPLP